MSIFWKSAAPPSSLIFTGQGGQRCNEPAALEALLAFGLRALEDEHLLRLGVQAGPRDATTVSGWVVVAHSAGFAKAALGLRTT